MLEILKNIKVLIVIPVHNRLSDFEKLLLSLVSLDVTNISLSIALVDDGSDLPIKAKIEKQFNTLNIFFFRNNKPKGPGYSRNLAARSINSDFIWFLDSDTEILNKNILVYFIKKFNSDEFIGASGGDLQIINNEKRVMVPDILINFFGLFKSYDINEFKASYVDLIATSNLIVKRTVFESVGGFREDLLRDEDKDLCLSIRKLGYLCYQDLNTLVWHKLSSAGRSSGFFAHFADPIKFIEDFLKTRAKLIAIHAPWRLFFLPVLDLVVTPIVLYRVKFGIYSNSRFKKVAEASFIKKVFFFIVKYIECYFWSFNLSCKKSIKKD